MTQMIDTLDPEETKRYIHHYNFPPFSTGEVGRIGSPRRREIGHGALAERALVPVIPRRRSSPTRCAWCRTSSTSNGSTSMASVCASTLSLMDAGVPIKAPVAGIAMGLIAESGRYVTLTDILGAEDALGDMDFKVAGTSDFVTAIQLDMKVTGLPAEVLAGALKQAKEARLLILDAIRDAIPEPRTEVNPKAPRILTIQIPVDKIGEVIGPKGKRINEIIALTGADIDIQDDGTVFIGLARGRRGGRGGADDRRDRQPAPAHGRRAVQRHRREHHDVRRVREPRSRPRRPDAHLEARQGQAALDVEDAVKVGDTLEVEVQDIDDRGQDLPQAGGRGVGDPRGRWSRRSRSDRPPRRDRTGTGGRARPGPATPRPRARTAAIAA